MRKFKSIAAFILALIMLIPALIACDNGEDPAETTEAPAPETTEAPAPEALQLNNGDKALFTIVRPDTDGGDDPVYDLAKDIAKDLEKATGAKFKHETDFISWNTQRDPEKYELIVGHTNYDETAEVLSELKYYDYAIVIRGHKIIIAAYTQASLRKAVTYFRNNIIPMITKDEAGNGMLTFEDQINRGVYKVEALTLDGNDIADYTVVYPDSAASGEKMAQAAIDIIASATGIYLPMMSDKEAEKPLEILVGETNRAASAGSKGIANLNYNVSLQSGKLVVDCRGLTSCDAGVRKLYSEHLSAGGSIALTSGQLCAGTSATETEFPMTAGSDLRIVTYNILKESWITTPGLYADTAERAELFGGFLDIYQPDVVGVQEVGEKWLKYMPAHLGKYKLTGTKRDDKGMSYSAIVYNAEKYDIIAQGCPTYSKHASAECRNMSWAILQDKTSGTKFAFISTHWDFGSETAKEEMRRVQADELTAKIKSLKAEYNCPVIITGDFNCSNASESYSYFMAKNGMTNALTSSEYYYNAKGTNSIDFVMITTGDGVFKGYKKLQENGLSKVSDHWANLADIDLK